MLKLKRRKNLELSIAGTICMLIFLGLKRVKEANLDRSLGVVEDEVFKENFVLFLLQMQVLSIITFTELLHCKLTGIYDRVY